MTTKTVDEILAGFKSEAKLVRGGAYDRRTVEGHADLHPGEAEGSTIRVVLSVSHNKDRKEYSATVHLTQIMPPERGFHVSKWEPMNRRHNLRLPGIPVARYTEKSNLAAYEKALAFLAEDPALLTEKLDLEVTSIA